MRWFLSGILTVNLVTSFQRDVVASEPEKAEALFNQGVKQMLAGNYAQGCPRIRESLYIEHLPGALYTLALCEDQWGHGIIAQALYKRYVDYCSTLASNEKAHQKKRIDIVNKRLDELGQEIQTKATPQLTVHLAPNAPKGTIIKLAGEIVGKDKVGTPMKVNPGTYLLTTQTPDGRIAERQVELREGQRSAIVLPIASPMHPRMKTGLVLAGIGVASLVGSLVSFSFDRDYDTIHPSVTSYVTLGAGVSFSLTGLLLTATAPKPISPTKTAQTPSFYVGLLRADSTSVMGGFYGTW